VRRTSSPRLPWPRTLVALALAVVVAGGLLAWRFGAEAARRPSEERIVRLHVVAHSNRTEDQTLKLHVRDRLQPLVNELSALLSEEAAAGPAPERLALHLDELLRAAREELARRGAPYGAQLALEPDAADRLAAIKIVLGDGAGANWFCVLVPPLCFSDMDAVERRPAGDGQQAGVRFAWRWLDQLFSRLSVPVERVGQVDENNVDADLAHAGPRNGDVGTAAE